MNRQTDRQTEEKKTSCENDVREDELKDLPNWGDGKGGFRLSNQKLMLTYRTHIPKFEFIEFIEEVFCITPTFIRIAHETGDKSHEYLHSHVLIDFGKVINKKNAERVFDYTEIHPQIKIVKNSLHWKRCLRYLAKEDPDNKDLKDEPNIVEGIWACETEAEMLKKYCKKPGDALGLKALWSSKQRESDHDWTLKELRPSQLKIIELINGIPDQRTVNFIYNKPGGLGKTALIRHLIKTQPGRVMCLTQFGKLSDVAQCIKGYIDKGFRGDTCIINLSRQCVERDSIYAPLEMICDCIATTTKWQGETFLFNPMTVIVFANFLPDVDKMSLDRWNIIRVDKEGDWTHVPVNIARSARISILAKEKAKKEKEEWEALKKEGKAFDDEI